MSPAVMEVQREVGLFKIQSKEFEEQVKDWELEFSLKDLNESSRKFHKTFVDLQTKIASFDKNEDREKLQKRCFEIIRGLISHFDCNVRTEDLDYIYKHEVTREFTHLWDHIHEYCNGIISKHPWAQRY